MTKQQKVAYTVEEVAEILARDAFQNRRIQLQKGATTVDVKLTQTGPVDARVFILEFPGV